MQPLEPVVIWDLDDDPEGNVYHIAEHGITKDEVWDVVSNPNNTDVPSHSSGRPAPFGWTQTGKHIIVIWEAVADDPRTIYPVTAYETPPPREKKKSRRRKK
ncbi:MAG: hypothetical protein HYR84_11655 [Planctomycetes bacterium]|nr:hypothetical protein [Planctomycetota bacterium]